LLLGLQKQAGELGQFALRENTLVSAPPKNLARGEGAQQQM
jgi:hypothetical protein